MKKYIYTGLIMCLLLSIIGLQYKHIKGIKAQRDIYKENTIVLMTRARQYKTQDSLNAISVGNLELKLSEFEKYRSEDAKLIKTLQTKNRNPERVTTTELSTVYELHGNVRDSSVYRADCIVDTLRCVDIIDKWFELHGCTNMQNEFSGTFVSRDSLLYVETVKHKRFLGFLWKTGAVKDRKQDIVSRNPHTTIIDAEFITIER